MPLNLSRLNKINEAVYHSGIRDLPPTGCWPQPGFFGIDPKVLFIGQNPGMPKDGEPWMHDKNDGIYLSYVLNSPTGGLLSDAIRQAGLKIYNIAYTNVVKSPTPYNRVPTDEEINYYMNILNKQIDCLDIRKVVVFGKIAKEAVLAKLNISYSPQFLFVYHPAYVLRAGNRVEYINEISSFIKE